MNMTRGLWLILALAGAALCAVLLIQSIGVAHTLPGCGPASGCDDVLASRWSAVFNLPVSLPALGAYLVLVALWPSTASTARTRDRTRTWLLATAIAAVLAAAAVWFVFVQAVLLGHWCVYCTSAHAVGAALALVILMAQPRDTTPRRHRLTAAALGVAAAAVLAVIQLLTPPPGPRVVQFGGIVGAPTNLPTHGDPQAPHVVLVLSDYTCAHCRELHQHLAAAATLYGQSLVIAVKPVALDAACNPHYRETPPQHQGACDLAKLALALWRVDPEQFPAFDDWLFAAPGTPGTPGSPQAEGFSPGSDSWPRTPVAARTMAQSLVDPAALDDALRSPWVADTLAANIALSEQLGGVLPIVLARRAVMLGRPGSEVETLRVLAQQFGPAN